MDKDTKDIIKDSLFIVIFVVLLFIIIPVVFHYGSIWWNYWVNKASAQTTMTASVERSAYYQCVDQCEYLIK